MIGEGGGIWGKMEEEEADAVVAAARRASRTGLDVAVAVHAQNVTKMQRRNVTNMQCGDAVGGRTRGPLQRRRRRCCAATERISKQQQRCR